MNPGEPVLDASALLAYLRSEPGAETVAEALDAGAIISATNLAEVLSRVGERGWDPAAFARDLIDRGILHGALLVEDFTFDDSVEAARLRPLTRNLGLSLADRACLALALKMDFPVLTADKAWGDLDIGIDVRLIR
jgi:PIN domain nuclease of toxin-antitoxin system